MNRGILEQQQATAEGPSDVTGGQFSEPGLPSSAELNSFDLLIGNQVFPITYSINGGQLNSITPNPSNFAITLDVIPLSSQNGDLAINLPRTMMDSIGQLTGVDLPFMVFDEGVPITDFVSEDPLGQPVRPLTIPFDGNAPSRIQIQGTQMVVPPSEQSVGPSQGTVGFQQQSNSPPRPQNSQSQSSDSDNPDNNQSPNNQHSQPLPQVDFDKDGIGDDIDNCPGSPNADQKDTDNDKKGDVCDDMVGSKFASSVLLDQQNDSDNDGVDDSTDNCISLSNPNQEDADNDGIGDECDNEINEETAAEPIDVQEQGDEPTNLADEQANNDGQGDGSDSQVGNDSEDESADNDNNGENSDDGENNIGDESSNGGGEDSRGNDESQES